MRKKLIEVALPLEAINKASAQEKSNPFLKGHPRALHQWWARLPLATSRAILFASIVDDPGQPDVPPGLLAEVDKLPAPAMPREEWLALDLVGQRRQRLFAFIERLVQWENSTDEGIIGTARRLILAATGGSPPPVLDPFCGGGSIPLEAQRLGLEAHASDLNPVAVLITKALIEIPSKFAGMPPVNPASRRQAAGAGAAWKGAAGLAEDVRYYGRWMRDEAERRIGHLYPKVQLPKEYGGEATVIAWLWARTVKCPNPACGAQMPLVSSFWLSKKAGKQAWVEPVVERPHPPAPSPTGGEGEAAGVRWAVPEALRRRMVAVAQELRREATPSEERLWEALRGRQLAGVKVRRQQPIGPFVVDFFVPAHRLVIEVDGPIHEQQRAADRERQQLLESLGLRVLRLPAALVERDLPAAMERVRAMVVGFPHPPAPSPTRGEGESWPDTRASSPSPLVGEGVGGVRVRFTVRTGAGQPPDPPKVGRGARFRCLACEQVAAEQHIKDEGKAGRLGAQLMAIVAEGQHGRVYLPPTAEHEAIASLARPEWRPDQRLANDPRNIWCVGYGLDTFGKLFTPRQLVALTTFSDLVGEARTRGLADAVAAGLAGEGEGLEAGGTGAMAYADAVATYLAFGLDKASDYGNSISTWNSANTNIRQLFSKQAMQMSWDFVEVNPLFGSLAYSKIVEGITEAIDRLPSSSKGAVNPSDASIQIDTAVPPLVSTDPPYYDNIGYADLADFFYIWLRRSINEVFTGFFRTVLTPKSRELVASPYRFDGGREKARDFFEAGLSKAFLLIRAGAHHDYPVSVYYAFKQAESEDDDNNHPQQTSTSSTGWETMLEGLLRAGFLIVGTWPVRCARNVRSVALGTNALTSYIVLVCRPRPKEAPVATRRDFLNALQRELPAALRDLQRGNIAPVDLAQASIGPGMAVFSRYGKVLEADGSPMRVRTALALINQALDAFLTEQEGEYDADTRWALTWYEQHGFGAGSFDEAMVLARAKVTSTGGMQEAGILVARAGKVRLLRREELPRDWNPAADERVPVWELTQQLVRAHEAGGEAGAAWLLARAGVQAEAARDLAYRLYSLCERKGWAPEALAYNSLVTAWPAIAAAAARAAQAAATGLQQERLV